MPIVAILMDNKIKAIASSMDFIFVLMSLAQTIKF